MIHLLDPLLLLRIFPIFFKLKMNMSMKAVNKAILWKLTGISTLIYYLFGFYKCEVGDSILLMSVCSDASCLARILLALI